MCVQCKMGNRMSAYGDAKEKEVFQKELSYVTSIVNGIMTEKDIFKNRDYNFLSQDVCNNHYIIMESELNRHLKVQVQNLGSTLYLIPKDTDTYYQKINVDKKEVCKRISQHYMKILYILCLIKYVYNIENSGDFSISGIIFRNIRFVNHLAEVYFCNVPQKDFNKQNKEAYKLDFSELEGFQFLTRYFLDNKESHAFLRVMRNILARNPKSHVQKMICKYVADTTVQSDHLKQLEKMYQDRYNEKMNCKGIAKDARVHHNKKVNLSMFVARDNPVLSKDYCFEMHKLIIQLNTPTGRAFANQYRKMKSNYDTNIKSIENLLYLLVTKVQNGMFELKDVDKTTLDNIIYKVKDTIKLYYLQSLLDYHRLLDLAKSSPTIDMR